MGKYKHNAQYPTVRPVTCFLALSTSFIYLFFFYFLIAPACFSPELIRVVLTISQGRLMSGWYIRLTIDTGSFTKTKRDHQLNYHIKTVNQKQQNFY